MKIGLATVCTTPDEPVWLHGYMNAERRRPSEGKFHDLHAKAMAFEDEAGERAILITLDLCVLRAEEADAYLDAIIAATGLEPHQVFLNLSHTHSGPIIGRSELHRFSMSDEDRCRTLAYTEALRRRLGEVAAAALADLQPAVLRRGMGNVDFVRNRRRFDETGRYAGMGPNPAGFTDPRVHVLRVDAPDGTPRALLFALACHAVTFGPSNLKVSGDYPGFAQADVEARFPGVQAMFAQGCGADANSEPRDGSDPEGDARAQGRRLADEVARVAQGALRTVDGPLRSARGMAELPLRALDRDQLEAMAAGPSWYNFNARRWLEMLDRGETPPTSYRAPVSVLRFDDSLTVVAISGEVVSGYIPLAEKAVGSDDVLVLGYTNQVFGYLPTADIIEQGGYEDRGLVSEIGYFAPEAQDAVVATVRRLAAEVSKST